MAPPLSRPKDAAAPSVFVYDLSDIEAALAVADTFDTPLTLWLREDVAAGYGAAVIGKLFALARSSHPHPRFIAAVDCGAAPGFALALLRRGIDRVSLRGDRAMLARVSDIAARTGAALAPAPANALDLLGINDPKKACEMWLSRFTTDDLWPHQNNDDLVD